MKEDHSQYRNMIFLSHAWEDFEFTRWLALQLAKEGYGVWCDLTKLLGGENWPNEINRALQQRTRKFLFILSRSSNTKPDPLGELETARKVMTREAITNFIVPLKIDDISRDEVDYRLQEIQSISFDHSWAVGLSNLLTLLQEEVIPQHSSFSPSAVNEWWRRYGTDVCKIIDSPEELYSNRFPILSYPENLYAHYVNEEPRLRGHLEYPIVPFKEYILSFADAATLQARDEIESSILDSHQILINNLLAGADRLIGDPKTGSYYFTRLMNQAFMKGVESKGLRAFRLARGYCHYFNEDILSQGRIDFTNAGELDSRIKLWGKFKKERWYWAVRARMESQKTMYYTLYSHVLVRGKRGIRAAPKGVYKSWRNDKWRDRLKASVVHLANDSPYVELNVGRDAEIRFSKDPITYMSPSSYEEPKEQVNDGEVTDDRFEHPA